MARVERAEEHAAFRAGQTVVAGGAAQKAGFPGVPRGSPGPSSAVILPGRSSGDPAPHSADTPTWDHGPMLSDRLLQVTEILRSALADFEPERLSGPDAARLLEIFAEIEKLASGGKLLSARRVESSNVWRHTGHRSAAAHIAQATGTGLGPAITTLEAARQLGSLPATDQAVRSGRLSEAQVKEIAGAAIIQPEAERALVEAAGNQPLSVLKLRCRRVKSAGRDQRAAYDAIRRERYLRNWVDGEGAVRFDARLTPDEGARLVAAVRAQTGRLAGEARRAGVDEPRRALAADALIP